MLPPGTGSFGELGVCTIPPPEDLVSGPLSFLAQIQGPRSPGPPRSASRLVKWTVRRKPIWSILASWSVHQSASTEFVAAWKSWLSIEPLCSLNEECTCIAIEYAESPLAATSRAAERSGSRGIFRNSTAAAPATAVPCKKLRLDNPDSVAGTLLAVWSSHIGYTRPCSQPVNLTQETGRARKLACPWPLLSECSGNYRCPQALRPAELFDRRRAGEATCTGAARAGRAAGAPFSMI